MRFSTPADLGAESIEFFTLTIREIAAGFGLPYKVLSGDLSEANYCIARVALVEFRGAASRRCNTRRSCSSSAAASVARWVTLEALAGRLDAGAFAANPEALPRRKWLAPKQIWVDPLKDAQGEREAIAAGFMSRRAGGRRARLRHRSARRGDRRRQRPRRRARARTSPHPLRAAQGSPHEPFSPASFTASAAVARAPRAHCAASAP